MFIISWFLAKVQESVISNWKNGRDLTIDYDVPGGFQRGVIDERAFVFASCVTCDICQGVTV